MTARLLAIVTALGLIGCSATPIHLPGDPDGGAGDSGSQWRPDTSQSADMPEGHDFPEPPWDSPDGSVDAEENGHGDGSAGVGDAMGEAREGGASDASDDADAGDVEDAGDAGLDAEADQDAIIDTAGYDA